VPTERLPADAPALKHAAELLRRGRLVAFPTETVYGLGARADESAAVRGIFEAKGRPSQNPLIVHVATLAEARALSTRWTEAAETLARAFWPGPLTLVVEAKPGALAGEVTAFGPTVALRIPAHPVALALLAEVALPLAAPSANRSTSISPTTADHVLKSLDGRIDLVLDGGPTGFGIESTIIDVTSAPAVLLRPGAVPLASIAALVAVVDRGPVVVAPGELARAPGGLLRHYAPRARVTLRPPENVRDEVLARRVAGEHVGALERAPGSVDEAPCERLPDDPAGYAEGLYAALHRLDDLGCDAIVIAEPPQDRRWDAVRDRLRRASA
jgi:L-threonylcarbamoyladenylate synthase